MNLMTAALLSVGTGVATITYDELLKDKVDAKVKETASNNKLVQNIKGKISEAQQCKSYPKDALILDREKLTEILTAHNYPADKVNEFVDLINQEASAKTGIVEAEVVEETPVDTNEANTIHFTTVSEETVVAPDFSQKKAATSKKKPATKVTK